MLHLLPLARNSGESLVNLNTLEGHKELTVSANHVHAPELLICGGLVTFECVKALRANT